MTLAIDQMVHALAAPGSRQTVADRIAAEIGAEAFLIFLYDAAVGAWTPAPGFSQTLPGGAAWRTFLQSPSAASSCEIELPWPTQDEVKVARALVTADAIFMLIGGQPHIDIQAFADARLLPALLRSEAEQLGHAGQVLVAREATARATNLAQSLDKARAELRRKADELTQALRQADLLNEQLTDLNETLEQRISERTRQRNMLATIVESTDVMVMACDLEYNILAVNKSLSDEFERIYGMRPRSGDNMLALLAEQPGQQAQVRAGWGRALGGEETTFVEDFGDPDRARPYYEIKFRNLCNEAGERIGAYQFVTDVTERLRQDAQLAEAQDALRQSQKMESIGQLTGGVAHDFNNLLTPIIMVLDRLQRNGVGDQRDQRLISGAVQSAERAKTLVQRLLAFARRQPLQPTAVNIADLVAGMRDLILSTSGPQIEVLFETADNLPPAKADSIQIEMALLNLSVNARDAMPDGGTLRITANEAQVQADNCADLRPGHYLRLAVTDTGVGMDAATAARAIEPFFSTKGIGQGTGLGLSMAHGLASQLGGSLTIDSTPGAGTTIELWLPVSKDAVDAVTAAPKAQGVNTGAGSALLVDDEDLVRTSTAEMLRELGYEVSEASSAEEALDLISNGLQPELLVTDHLMPGMNGTELARRVRADRPDTQILVISGYAGSAAVAPDLPRLVKPFRSDELRASLAAIGKT